MLQGSGTLGMTPCGAGSIISWSRVVTPHGRAGGVISWSRVVTARGRL